MKAFVLVVSVGLISFCLTGCLGVRGDLFASSDADPSGRLRLDGYYADPHLESPGSRSTGAIIFPFLLWENGTAAHFPGIGGFIGDDPAARPIRHGTLEDAHEEFRQILKDSSRFNAGRRSLANWGAFSIWGDSIAVRIVRPIESLVHTHKVFEYKGVILSDTSLSLNTYPSRSDRADYRTYYFQPLAEKPAPDNWTNELRQR
jgi:hypothetical protein